MKQSKFKHQTINLSQQKQQRHLIDVYIRNNKKQALLIHTQNIANVNHISHVIQQKFKIPKSEQLLFHNGEQILINNNQQVQLSHKSIIHLVDHRNITKNIIINLRRLNVPKSEQYKISTSQIIEDFIVRNIQGDHQQLFFVYTGRQLNSKKSFAEQFVEDKSQIFCLHQTKDEVIGESRVKYERRLQQMQQKHKEDRAQQSHNQNQLDNNQQIKQSVSRSEDLQRLQQKQVKQDGQQSSMPNFKKKTTTKEINICSNQQIQIKLTNPINQHNSSIILENQMNKSSISPNPFFNQGSSISEIMPEDFHNPQSSKRQSSLMFQSAYIGLNNENSIINNHNMNLRGIESLIQNPNQEQEQIQNESSQKYSINFDVRAPQMLQQRDAIHQEFITEQQNQDYSESIDANSQYRVKANQIKLKKQMQQDISQFELQMVQNHKLSVSADMDAGKILIENRMQNSHNQIATDENQQNQIKDMNYLGLEIEPISCHPNHEDNQNDKDKHKYHQDDHKNHQEQHQYHQEYNQNNQEQYQTNQNNQQQYQNNKNHHQNHQSSTQKISHLESHQPNCEEINLYYLQGSQLVHATESEVIEQKYECETNGREGSSNFHSNASSRVKKEFNFQSEAQQQQIKDIKRFSRFNKQAHNYENQQIIEQQSSSGLENRQNIQSQLLQNKNQSVEEINKNHEAQVSLNIVEMALMRNSSIFRESIENRSNVMMLDQTYGQNLKEQKGFMKNGVTIDSKIQQLNNLFSQIRLVKDDQLQSKLKEELPEIQIRQQKHITKTHQNNHQQYNLLQQNEGGDVERKENEDFGYGFELSTKLKFGLQNHQQIASKYNRIDMQQENDCNFERKYENAIVNENVYKLGSFIFKNDLKPFSAFNYFFNTLSQQFCQQLLQPSQ